MDINTLLLAAREYQNGFTVILTAFLQALFLKTHNIRIILTIILSSTFVIIYIDPFIFEYFNIKEKSGLGALVYGVSTLIGAEIVQFILVFLPPILRSRAEKLIGISYLKRKD